MRVPRACSSGNVQIRTGNLPHIASFSPSFPMLSSVVPYVLDRRQTLFPRVDQRPRHAAEDTGVDHRSFVVAQMGKLNSATHIGLALQPLPQRYLHPVPDGYDVELGRSTFDEARSPLLWAGGWDHECMIPDNAEDRHSGWKILQLGVDLAGWALLLGTGSLLSGSSPTRTLRPVSFGSGYGGDTSGRFKACLWLISSVFAPRLVNLFPCFNAFLSESSPESCLPLVLRHTGLQHTLART
ncbi:hypothetical protein LXA43DRAFT_600245 [Ganoderma leucocontextum]|nr:hypothetical protein LXA43DRAFT_600245 [Ganoderma leucocontextum]